jgi:hypothetical protein
MAHLPTRLQRQVVKYLSVKDPSQLHPAIALEVAQAELELPHMMGSE